MFRFWEENGKEVLESWRYEGLFFIRFKGWGESQIGYGNSLEAAMKDLAGASFYSIEDLKSLKRIDLDEKPVSLRARLLVAMKESIDSDSSVPFVCDGIEESELACEILGEFGLSMRDHLRERMFYTVSDDGENLDIYVGPPTLWLVHEGYTGGKSEEVTMAEYEELVEKLHQMNPEWGPIPTLETRRVKDEKGFIVTEYYDASNDETILAERF